MLYPAAIPSARIPAANAEHYFRRLVRYYLTVSAAKGSYRLMLTTSSADEDRLHSLNPGANQFLTKPTTSEQLQTIAQELSITWALT